MQQNKLIYIICIIFFPNFGLSNLDLRYPGHSSKLKAVFHMEWEKYYGCLKKDVQALGTSLTRRVEARLVFPGQSTRLRCTQCQRPLDKTTKLDWRFYPIGSNYTTPVYYFDLTREFLLIEEKDLFVMNAKPDFTGFYECILGNNSLNVYMLEVPASPDIVQVNSNDSSETMMPFSQFFFNTTIVWGRWSECNKCTSVGRRYQYGACYILATKPNMKPEMGIHKTQTDIILDLFKNGLPCSSQLLPAQTALALKNSGATHFFAAEFCKEECSTPIESTLNTMTQSTPTIKTVLKKLSERVKSVERDIVGAHIDSRLTLQCPGMSNESIPITWKAMETEIEAEKIAKQSEGRITVDPFSRIIIHRVQPVDDTILSCWQRENLLGVIYLEVEQLNKGANQASTFLTVLTVLAITLLTLRILIAVFKHGRQQVKK